MEVEIKGAKRSDISKVGKNLDRWLADLWNELEEVIAFWAEKVFDEAVRQVPVDTGNLRSTIEIKLKEKALEIVSAMIGTKKTTYAKYVEKGTWKMDAQPYLKPALQKYAQKFVQAVANKVRAHARRAHRYKSS